MLITDAYTAEQRAMHAKYHAYGSASIGYAPIVSNLINQFKITDLLDYGAGKCRLSEHLTPQHKCTVTSYDPAIEAIALHPNQPHECVACIDVLEHVEPECLDSVLDDLMLLTGRLAILTVHCGPAVKVLSDGRNAHLIQQPPVWWLPQIMRRFELESFIRNEQGFWVVVSPKRQASE